MAGRTNMLGEEEKIKRVYKNRRQAAFNYYDIELRARNLYEFLNFIRNHKLELKDLRILDFGCGNGSFLFDLIKSGARPEYLHAYDLRTDKLRELSASNPNVKIHLTDESIMNEKFDIIILNLVFSSITDDEHRGLVAGKIKSLEHKWIFNYDFAFRNPTNPNVNKFTPKDFEKYFYKPVSVVRFGILPTLGRILCATRLGRVVKNGIELFPFLNTHFVCCAFKR